MRRLVKVDLGGEWFTIKTRPASIRYTRFEAWKTANCDRDDLYNHYKKPSDIKLAIWHDWCEWASANDAYLQIAGSNGFAFSIAGLMRLSEKWYYIDITKSHNWLFPIEIIED